MKSISLHTARIGLTLGLALFFQLAPVMAQDLDKVLTNSNLSDETIVEILNNIDTQATNAVPSEQVDAPESMAPQSPPAKTNMPSRQTAEQGAKTEGVLGQSKLNGKISADQIDMMLQKIPSQPVVPKVPPTDKDIFNAPQPPSLFPAPNKINLIPTSPPAPPPPGNFPSPTPSENENFTPEDTITVDENIVGTTIMSVIKLILIAGIVFM